MVSVRFAAYVGVVMGGTVALAWGPVKHLSRREVVRRRVRAGASLLCTS